MKRKPSSKQVKQFLESMFCDWDRFVSAHTHSRKELNHFLSKMPSKKLNDSKSYTELLLEYARLVIGIPFDVKVDRKITRDESSKLKAKVRTEQEITSSIMRKIQDKLDSLKPDRKDWKKKTK